MAEAEPAGGEGGEPEGGEGEEKKLEYCHEISEEQLTAFYEKAAADNEEAAKYVALDILKLPDFTYDGNIGMIVDYFVGILMFAQEEHMSPPHTLLMYQLGMETLENIKCSSLPTNCGTGHRDKNGVKNDKSEKVPIYLSVVTNPTDEHLQLESKATHLLLVPLSLIAGYSMKKTEKKFKNLVFRWTVKVKNTSYVPVLTTIELQKIVPYFMSTVFQHYKLFSFCFNREPLHWKYYEEVFIEYPGNMLYPLKDFDLMEEIDEDKQAWIEYEKAWAEWEAERVAKEMRAQWLLENPLFPPEPKRDPENLDEAIEFSVRDKVEQVFNLMQEQYQERKSVICDRVKTLKANDPNSAYLRRLKAFGIMPHI